MLDCYGQQQQPVPREESLIDVNSPSDSVKLPVA